MINGEVCALVCILLLAMTLICSCTVLAMEEDRLVAEAIASGVDPVRAACGFDPRADLCLINETKSK
jgi:hypothetical protein